MAVVTGKGLRATSTITQQLARTVFLNNSRSYTRKLREGVLALALEWKFSKDQILELYLNKVYFGGGAYGVDAASRKFFGHPGPKSPSPKRRSSPAWSRRRRTIHQPPIPTRRLAALRSCCR